MSFLRRSSEKYKVNMQRLAAPKKYCYQPPDMKKLKSHHHPVIAELKRFQNSKKSTQETTKRDEFKQKMDFLKEKAQNIEEQILSDLKLLHELHRQEIEIFRDEVKDKDVAFQQELQRYFTEQGRFIEGVVYKSARSMLELDSSNKKDVEMMLRKMLDDLGMEAEKVVWEKKTKKVSKWEKIKAFFKFS